MSKDLPYYRALPYGRAIAREARDDGSVYFVAWIREIPWIRIHGSDEPEARTRLGGMFEDAIEAMIESRDKIPEPVLWPDSVGTVPAPRARWRRTETAKPTPTVEQDPAEPWLPLHNNPEMTGV